MRFLMEREGRSDKSLSLYLYLSVCGILHAPASAFLISRANIMVDSIDSQTDVSNFRGNKTQNTCLQYG